MKIYFYYFPEIYVIPQLTKRLFLCPIHMQGKNEKKKAKVGMKDIIQQSKNEKTKRKYKRNSLSLFWLCEL